MSWALSFYLMFKEFLFTFNAFLYCSFFNIFGRKFTFCWILLNHDTCVVLWINLSSTLEIISKKKSLKTFEIHWGGIFLSIMKVFDCWCLQFLNFKFLYLNFSPYGSVLRREFSFSDIKVPQKLLNFGKKIVQIQVSRVSFIIFVNEVWHVLWNFNMKIVIKRYLGYFKGFQWV